MDANTCRQTERQTDRPTDRQTRHGDGQTCRHADMQTCIHAYMHPCIHASMHPCIHTSIHPYIHTSIHPSIHPSIHTYIHACNAFVARITRSTEQWLLGSFWTSLSLRSVYSVGWVGTSNPPWSHLESFPFAVTPQRGSPPRPCWAPWNKWGEKLGSRLHRDKQRVAWWMKGAVAARSIFWFQTIATGSQLELRIEFHHIRVMGQRKWNALCGPGNPGECVVGHSSDGWTYTICIYMYIYIYIYINFI